MEQLKVIELLGGLGVFLFGMKLMSESLQSAVGDNLRTLLNKMTTNKFAAALSGMTITATIQSSSATTVMVVGFVNAGLLQLRQGIGVIMGANIGTTVTAWMIAFLGFGKFKINKYALPVIVIGVILLFTNREKLTSWGQTLIGFGLMFLGLSYIKGAIPDFKQNPEAFFFITQYANMGFWSVIIFVLIGTLLTVIVQSSSTATAITIALAVKGHISPDLAMAMILGENIGTTITANLAALAGNLNAKKAALAHTMFNLFGVIWILFIFSYVSQFLIESLSAADKQDKKSVGYMLSIFHTGFNVTNTFLLIWFIPQLENSVNAIADRMNNFINRLLGRRAEEAPSFKLLSSGSVRSAELSLLEITAYSKQSIARVLGLFPTVSSLIVNHYSKKKANEIFSSENELDKYREAMLSYLNEIQSSGVTGETAQKLMTVSEWVRLEEQLGDNFARIARKLKQTVHADRPMEIPR